jgi:hypothetical protein
MICKTCQIAGDMVAVARDWVDGEVLTVDGVLRAGVNVPTKEAVRSVAHLFHGLCKGHGHCDCQHKVDFEGKALQKK